MAPSSEPQSTGKTIAQNVKEIITKQADRTRVHLADKLFDDAIRAERGHTNSLDKTRLLAEGNGVTRIDDLLGEAKKYVAWQVENGAVRAR